MRQNPTQPGFYVFNEETNRLVAGPFKTQQQANETMHQLTAPGADMCVVLRTE